MKSESIPNFVLGISDKSTVKLDFDAVPLMLVKYWTRRTCNWFKLESFIIFESRIFYHIFFNKPVFWEMNVRIMCCARIHVQIYISN